MPTFKWVSCSIIVPLLLVSLPAPAASLSSLVDEGNAAYEAGNYDAALNAYERAAGENPESSQIDFNKGAAYFRKGDLPKAKDAWEKAALNAKELSLEAKALFNLGNLSFSEAERQKDSDLQKSIDDCTRSIAYYQQAINLLNNPESLSDSELRQQAAQNIEMVRLVMKSILDELQKQQKHKKQREESASHIQEIISKQQALNKRHQSNMDAEQTNRAGDQFPKKAADLADEQRQLSAETQDAENALADQQNSDTLEKGNQQQENAVVQLPDDAESIIDEEKENQKNRRPLTPGGYADIDKDW